MVKSKKQFAIMKIRQRIIKSIRDFFDERGFVLIDSPMFTGMLLKEQQPF
ncbi:MAG: hypothetical protein Ct9H90mP15_09060 [Candidatus Neomarinimicrobiota bacterium]|nr:MAG: hypothetical protein Ct9H90mP15_09060 [Candidatus Neomarinimicrobiota bacterium]